MASSYQCLPFPVKANGTFFDRHHLHLLANKSKLGDSNYTRSLEVRAHPDYLTLLRISKFKRERGRMRMYARRTKGGKESSSYSLSSSSVEITREEEEEEYVAPKLPGDEPDFWEGPQWDTVGFIMQYLWAFGIVFALVACGVAVRTYNFGATDFKETPVYKEAIESQGLFDEAPETPESKVFETNPTEESPSPS